MTTTLQPTTETAPLASPTPTSLLPSPSQPTPLPSRSARSALSAAKKAGQRGRYRGLIWALSIVAVVIALFGAGFSSWWFFWRTKNTTDVTAVVTRADLPIIVMEKGDLDSEKNIAIRCDVEERQIKIIDLVPEGTSVKKGQVLAHLDADQLRRHVVEQEVKWKLAEGKAKAAEQDLEVQKNKAAKELTDAELALTLADLDKKKYQAEKGQYKVEFSKLEGAVALARKDLKEAEEKLQNLIPLVKSGSATLEQKRALELGVEKARLTLEASDGELFVLKEFTKRRQDAELDAKFKNAGKDVDRARSSGASGIAKASSEWDTAKQTAALEEDTLKRAKKQLEQCEVKSPADGILVYAPAYRWDPGSRIQAGGMVSFQQTMFTLPELDRMLVKVKIHESKVKKIKKGQKVEILIESIPDLVLQGTVESVAPLASSDDMGWMGGAKKYETIVKINDLPLNVGLKPGMTTQVKIMVNHLYDVLTVPVQAVAEISSKHYVYVQGRGGYEKREVEIGENNDQFVEIKDGLTEGEKIALDARARASTEAKGTEGQSNQEKPKETATAVPGEVGKL